MDSLTQIVLGAACGEAALGKKIGNKALLIGALAGTIPDLDVFVGRMIYNNEIDIMAFHRGFMHSFLFAVMGAFIFGWLFYKIYDRGKRKNVTYKKDWYWLFLFAFITHSMLDCFTPYGTQLFSPFSNYRVAFNNIAVADPAYTLPFLISLIVLMFFKRNTSQRKFWLKTGVGISTCYLICTLINKAYITSVFSKSLKENNIAFLRFQTQPTILNNILWYGIAETEDEYFVSFYSLFDSSTRPQEWHLISKNHNLVSQVNSDIQTLSWFSNGYYNLTSQSSNTIRYNDLRYPSFDSESPENSVFSFSIQQEDERYDILPANRVPPSTKDLAFFWRRIKGK